MKMQVKQLGILAFVTALALLLTSSAHAEALLVPITTVEPISPPQPPDQFRRRPPQNILPFRVTSSKVDVRIDENVATTSMEQSFLNLTGRDLEVRVMIPIPAGAAIDSSALSMNDQMVEGKLYDAQQAQTIFESIVNQRRDPALLRFVGDNIYEARVFPIPPNQERRLKFRYTQALTASSGMYDYKHILSGSQLYQNGIENFSFECTIRSKDPIGPVYSPSHQVAVNRIDERTAQIKLSGTNLSSDRNFQLYFAPSNSDVALRVITHRVSGDEGYFMLIGRADSQIEKAKILPKEIVFVADVSGSMQGEKIEQTKKALKFCLNSLSAQDRFNLITFSTDVQGLSSDKLLDATKENIAKALAAVDQIEATGGTNIEGALSAAVASDFTPGAAKAKSIVFMTDGLPTVGIVDPQTIMKGVLQANQAHKARIFNFGVGNDVNTHLLDKMSLDGDGVSSYVSPREDIEVKVSDFYSKIKHPVMTEVSVDFGSGKTNSVYPRRISALYRGGEILVMGRYKGEGPGEIVLTGNVGGEIRKIPLQVTWPARDLANSHLPRVWAMRKIGHLLEDLRLHGQNQEIIGEIVALAQRHGIVTPYTSQLVLEPGMDPNQFLTRRRGGEREIFDDATGGGGAPGLDFGAASRLNEQRTRQAEAGVQSAAKAAQQAVSGETAVALADFDKKLKEADGVEALSAGNKPAEKKEELRKLGSALSVNGAPAAKGDANRDEALGDFFEQIQQEAVKQVGTRTFYNRGGVWVDSTVKADGKKVSVKAFTPEYFALLKKYTDLGPVLALGGRIIVMLDGEQYEIGE